MTGPLVSSYWLQKNLNDPELVVLDASAEPNNSDFKKDVLVYVAR